ncbi:SDR family NAD(P)-dependent oxidoreductase [Sphingomonas sp. CGMCC 1.13654]|uniref:SDR family NAD(P)-dependent oxidoreductase n=1 Tax=Sphingomonas chungangi TaxID=2683589 RepID=A0A838L7E6_9SPHN|nr:SDR family NAD(P)-dependent oxidoreductase [Sphingomonas chungangi]MBA2934066.1 SDR family NAD(P)-dependent oxidoreductase [Sphingomonas chungangi]MVW57812.1 SDR family NAD(P)-dependent oxidoreductase [Sphingomonas chungangi]
MTIDLSNRVAIVTGAGGGLGREHAFLLAKRGAKVVVNELSEEGAERVVEEIRAAGGDAVAAPASVTEFAQVEDMVRATLGRWGRIDILVNNAGILRDKTFTKMDLSDFRLVMDVHVMGAVHCTKAVWEHMRERNYGRIVLTTSSSGLYGSFGQANYGAAKMALVGLMQTLALEGARNGIRVNCIAPTAATAMTENILSPEMLALLAPGMVSPGVLALVGEDAPTRTILCAGAGGFEQAHVTLTRGIFVGAADDAAEQIASRWSEIGNETGGSIPEMGRAQPELELAKAQNSRARQEQEHA